MLSLFDRKFGFSSRPPAPPPPVPAPPPPAPAAPAPPAYGDCSEALGAFITDSETVLGGIATVMTELYSGAAQIRGDAESCRDTITAGTASANAQLLEIAASLRSSLDRLDASRSLIENLDRRLSHVVTDFASLEAGVREFRVLGTLIRIEGTTRNDDSGDFVTISGQAAGIAANLGELVDQIREATASLRVTFRSVSREINRLTASSRQTLTALLAEVTTLDATMTTEHQAIGRAAEDTLAGLDRIRQAVGDLVCALQIHDTLRQQTEHNLAALADLSQPPGLDPASLLPCLAVLHAQLQNTLTLCHDSSRQAAAGLDAAASQLEQISALTQRVSHLTGPASPSRQALDASTQAIFAALPAIEQSELALQNAIAGLLDGAHSILAVVHQVSLAMRNMRWLGLNATIQSANHPQDGSAIETLGDRTASLAGAVDGECLQIRSALEQLRHEVSAYAHSASSLGQGGVRPVIETSAALVATAHHTIHGNMVRQADLQTALRDQLHRAHAALAAFRQVLAAPARAAEALAPTEPLALPATPPPPAAALLDAWFARYTMASERRAHSEALGLPFTESTPEPSAEGDIELF